MGPDVTGFPHRSSVAKRSAVVGLQPVALVDHVARVDWSLLHSVPGERGGSQLVSAADLKHILAEVSMHALPTLTEAVAVNTVAGGSVANTIRGLARGFGVPCALVGACGDDEQGQMFAENMEISGVDLSGLRVKKGHTGQCACLVDADGNRTMRPWLSNTVRIQADELTRQDFHGVKWVVLSAYGFYGVELVERAVELAKLEGALVSMDFSSFEVVRTFRPRLLQLLESGKIDLCFANEDEARELVRGKPFTGPETGLNFLAKYCTWAVVMLGSKGCIAQHKKESVRVPAIHKTDVIDTTGAGDLFASGFLYGMINGSCLEDCCKMGCCAGAAVVRTLGGEVTVDGWAWMHQQVQEQLNVEEVVKDAFGDGRHVSLSSI
eukprot:c25261_g1_i1 orf=134-1273(+)